MTMPDLFEQLDSPAENGDDWIRRLLSEPDETPSPTPAAATTAPIPAMSPIFPKRRKGLSRRRPQDRGPVAM